MTTTKRTAKPQISEAAETALSQFEKHLRELEDVAFATKRNYLSDLRLFLAWYETEQPAPSQVFGPAAITTPTLLSYRHYLQTILKPASVNRTLISLKRYFGWATEQGFIPRDPARVVKLVEQVAQPPRHLSDEEEKALLSAVSTYGSSRDQTLLVVLLHTGLRSQEICTLQRSSLLLEQRSGVVQVLGKGNKYREVPLNQTVRSAFKKYLPTLAEPVLYLFPSEKTGQALSERALGHLVKKYARLAQLSDVSPHDLRHRFGYKMARQKVALHRLAQIMGHSSLDTTMIYIQGTKSDLLEEVEKLR